MAQANAPIADGLSTSEEELATWAAELGSEDPGSRRRAFHALGNLEEESLPAIRERVAGYRALNSDQSYAALNSFRHAVGSRRADDVVDVIPGILTVLEENRSRVTVAMAERRLVLQSLASMGTLEAGSAIAEVLATDFTPWRWEAKRIVWGMGVHALPTLIASMGHPARDVRQWSRWGVRELGLSQPGKAVQEMELGELPDLLRAYGQVRHMDAMPVVVSFTTHERRQVREAARWATEQYGRNAIWQLRRVHRNLTGTDANRQWGWRRTMEALFTAHDAQRLAPVREELEAGLAALRAGDLSKMNAHFASTLRRAPDLPRRAEMAPGYAALGAQALEADQLEEARRHYRRAVRLAPDADQARAWRAELSFIEAEQSLSRGVVDVYLYARATELNPGHPRASAVLAAFEAGSRKHVPVSPRWPYAVLALLVVLGALWLLRRRPVEGAEDAVDVRANDGVPLGVSAIETAPDTLPG